MRTVWMNTQPVMCEHCRGKAHSRRRAPAMAHWGDIEGFLPHSDQMQVQQSTAEPELQKVNYHYSPHPQILPRGIRRESREV